MGSVAHLSKQVLVDLTELCPDMYKSPREQLATLVAVALEAGSCNTMEWAARLPIATKRSESRYAWVERFLSADTVDEHAVMQPLAAQILMLSAFNKQTIVLSLEQTSIENTHAIAMVSVRVGNRGLPLFWHTKAMAGNIPTADYLDLLDRVVEVMPEDADVLLMADRFFDAGALISYCRKQGWGWRIRLKSNMNMRHESSDICLKHMHELKLSALMNATLGSGVDTHVGYLHERGHEEAWFIAMNSIPSRTSTLDYGLRWGIEAMFSDYKTRGFGLEDTHLQRSDRLSKLLLVLAVAMHWAVITGLYLQKKQHQMEA